MHLRLGRHGSDTRRFLSFRWSITAAAGLNRTYNGPGLSWSGSSSAKGLASEVLISLWDGLQTSPQRRFHVYHHCRCSSYCLAIGAHCISCGWRTHPPPPDPRGDFNSDSFRPRPKHCLRGESDPLRLELGFQIRVGSDVRNRDRKGDS